MRAVFYVRVGGPIPVASLLAGNGDSAEAGISPGSESCRERVRFSGIPRERAAYSVHSGFPDAKMEIRNCPREYLGEGGVFRPPFERFLGA